MRLSLFGGLTVRPMCFPLLAEDKKEDKKEEKTEAKKDRKEQFADIKEDYTSR